MTCEGLVDSYKACVWGNLEQPLFITSYYTETELSIGATVSVGCHDYKHFITNTSSIVDGCYVLGGNKSWRVVVSVHYSQDDGGVV